jgi:hypothetical protein
MDFSFCSKMKTIQEEKKEREIYFVHFEICHNLVLEY